MRSAPVISIGAAQVMLPPGAFLQATGAGEETLAMLVEKDASGAVESNAQHGFMGPLVKR